MDLSFLPFPCTHLQYPRKKPGVYVIANLSSKKFYIGSSNNVSHRLAQHRFELKNNEHRNGYLMNAYKKNPKDFVYLLVEYTEKYQELEQELLDKYYDDQKICYNLSSTADRPTFREETRKEISERLKEMHKNNPKLRTYVMEYNKTEEARKLHSYHAKLQRQDPEYNKKLAEWVSKAKQKYWDVWLLDPNGERHFIGWNLKKFAESHKLSNKALNALIKGKAKSHLGWRLA